MRVNNLPFPCIAALLLAGSAVSLHAQGTSYTLPGGYTTLPGSPANTDSYRSINMDRPVEANGSGSVASATSTTITFAGSPGWTTNQWVPAAGETPFCVVVSSGTEDGLRGVITANDADTLTIATATPGDAANLAAGDALTIRKCWTAKDLFADTVVPDNTQLQLVDQSNAGVNQSADTILLHSGGNWFDSVFFTDANATIIHPGETFIIRTGVTPLPDVLIFGDVPVANHRVDLTKDGGAIVEDLFVAFSSPVDTPIDTLSWPLADNDQLLIFDNLSVGIQPGVNKSASQILIFSGGQWFDSETFANVTSTAVIESGVGYVIRRAAASPTTAEWNEVFSYRSSL